MTIARRSFLQRPRQFSWTRRFVKVVASLVLLAGITIGGLLIALENGVLDSTLTAQAEAGMSRALGDKFRPEVGSVRLRFSKDWMLAIEARQVVVTHLPSSLAALKADSVKAVLDPAGTCCGARSGDQRRTRQRRCRYQLFARRARG